jgi:diguanylate cyclase (GGDEF)-like protein
MSNGSPQPLIPLALVLAAAGAVLLAFADLERAVLVLAIAATLCGYAIWLRSRSGARPDLPPRDEDDRRVAEETLRRSQAEFDQALQSAGSEQDAYLLLQRNLERAIPRSTVVVLGRDDERLLARSPVTPGSAFSLRLPDARPDSCSAVRLGRPYERASNTTEPLVPCQLCGVMPTACHCEPCFAGGEIVGSVLVMRAEQLTTTERELVTDTVRRAAPALGSLRSLTVARLNAAADELTGLPSAQSVRESLKRMIAQAGRRIAPLSAIVAEVDHLQEIKDLCGPAKRDELFVAAAQALAVTARESDFVGHHGSERFVVLLPDTSEEGAATLAAKLRSAVSAIQVPGVERPVTASFGIAMFPRDGTGGESLLRAAERAVHSARTLGSNRIEIVSG